MNQAAFVTPNDFQGSDVERINRAIAAGATSGRPTVIPKNNENGSSRDLWLLDSAILLPANAIVELTDCRIKLSDRCRDNFFRSANHDTETLIPPVLENIHLFGRGHVRLEGADRPRATGDWLKTLGEQTYGTDSGIPGENQRGDWRNVGIRFSSVDHFSIENLFIVDSHGWAISCEGCTKGRLRDLNFDSRGTKHIAGRDEVILNQDGVDIRRGCRDILIENITGHTGDDLIALTALHSPSGGGVELGEARNQDQGIQNILIRNIRGFCIAGHNIIRLLNSPGMPLRNVLIDGLIDTSFAPFRSLNAIKIGDASPKYGGSASAEETSGILISNVITRAASSVSVYGALSDYQVQNVIHREKNDALPHSSLGLSAHDHPRCGDADQSNGG